MQVLRVAHLARGITYSEHYRDCNPLLGGNSLLNIRSVRTPGDNTPAC
jgi:hypothetical protein